ncbi:unnamed protein product [Ilex paraguariensis]
MNAENHRNLETSTEENELPEKFNDDTTGIGRSYECTFCKRGFTNAQALGGHMNIHRKDKAKATKQHTQKSSTSFSNKFTEDHMTSSFISPILSNQGRYYEVLGTQMMYFPASDSSYNLLVPRSEQLSVHEESPSPNLSLQVGSPNMGERKWKKRDGGEEKMENEVDLELRLGHDP